MRRSKGDHKESMYLGRIKKSVPGFPGTLKLSMVPETRIELVRVAPHAPQTCVSTISTTPALGT